MINKLMSYSTLPVYWELMELKLSSLSRLMLFVSAKYEKNKNAKMQKTHKQTRNKQKLYIYI